jgi:hypothetical protein
VNSALLGTAQFHDDRTHGQQQFRLQDRTQTHIFLCVLAYHLLAAIEKRFLDHDIHTSWWTLRSN